MIVKILVTGNIEVVDGETPPDDVLRQAACQAIDHAVKLGADIAGHAGPPPAGFVILERCDSCAKYKDDLAAAQAWGIDARWQEGNGTAQAIAKAKKELT